jgi:hypothetical protein
MCYIRRTCFSLGSQSFEDVALATALCRLALEVRDFDMHAVHL